MEQKFTIYKYMQAQTENCSSYMYGVHILRKPIIQKLKDRNDSDLIRHNLDVNVFTKSNKILSQRKSRN